MCAAVPGPLEGTIAESEIAKLFMAKCYERATTILTDQDKFQIAAAKFDTGAGSNLIWEGFMPTH